MAILIRHGGLFDDAAAARNILSCSLLFQLFCLSTFALRQLQSCPYSPRYSRKLCANPYQVGRRKSRNKTSKYTDLVSVLLVYNNVYSINREYNSTRIYFNLRCDIFTLKFSWGLVNIHVGNDTECASHITYSLMYVKFHVHCVLSQCHILYA